MMTVKWAAVAISLAKGDPVEGTFDTATKTFTATTEVA